MKKSVSKIVYLVARKIFRENDIRDAYRKTLDANQNVNSAGGQVVYSGMLLCKKLGLLSNLKQRHEEEMIAKPQAPQVFDAHNLHLSINRIYDLPDISVSENRKKTINVLVPAFEFKSISAGFFGVFQVAQFLTTTGYNVRLVLFDNFYFDHEEFRQKFQEYPGMENLLDALEVDYIGERNKPLEVSPDDYCLATVWYSAHFAEKITKHLRANHFFYLIQDYETNFFPGGTLFSLAEQTYFMNYIPMFSTQPLQQLFIKNNIGGFNDRKIDSIYFNNACSASLLPQKEFISKNEAKTKKKLVFYSRPVVNRNMFELTALAISEAYKAGIFNADEWECIGMGLGDGVIDLGDGHSSISLPRMTLKEYQETVNQFDICLTLMASPHPSLIPMDLAGSGAIVVTNTFATKKPDYLKGLSENIIPCAPTLPELLEGLKAAKLKSEDLESRYSNADNMSYPREWKDSLTQEHKDFFMKHMR